MVQKGEGRSIRVVKSKEGAVKSEEGVVKSNEGVVKSEQEAVEGGEEGSKEEKRRKYKGLFGCSHSRTEEP